MPTSPSAAPPVQPQARVPEAQAVPAAGQPAEPALYVPQPVQPQQPPAAPAETPKGVNKWAIGIIMGIALVFFAVILIIAATAGKK